MIERGYALQNRVVEAAASFIVRYCRANSVISEAMPATLSAAQLQSVDSNASEIIGRQFRWQFKGDELQWEGKQDRPRRDDVVEWTYGSRTYVFKVLPETLQSEALNVDPRSGWVPASAQLDEIRDT
jgi:hypothetical protein